MAEWSIARGCKPRARKGYEGSNPSPRKKYIKGAGRAFVAKNDQKNQKQICCAVGDDRQEIRDI